MIVPRKTTVAPTRRGMNPETKIRDAICEYLGNKLLCPEVSWISVNAGGFDYDRKVRYGLGPGTGDLVGMLVGGAYFEIEVKTATGRQSPEQRHREAHVNADRGTYVVLRSVEQAREWIATLRGEM